MTGRALQVRPVAALAADLAAGRVTASALLEACLDRIARLDPSLNAFITVDASGARAGASELDAELRAGRVRGPLHGIPLAIKDLLDVRGLPTTAASRVRGAHVASSDAPAIARLRAAGACLVGKCNLHEFAFGTTGVDSAWGPTRHPLDPGRSPGGSSSGSAAAVAAGLCTASVGTDTGGSIRIPAAACGLVGLKPGPEEIPRDGLVPLAPSLDCIGPLARTVADARLVYCALAGAPGRAAETALRDGRPEPAGLRLGVLRPYFGERLDPAVRSAFERAIDRLRAAGAGLSDAAIAHAGAAPAIYLLTVLAEAAAFHGPTLETRPQDYTANVRLRLEAGRHVPGEDYVRAQRGREVLAGEVDLALDGVDALILPTLPIPAPELDAEHVVVDGVEESVRALMLRQTQPFSLTGHPAISIPCGATPSGLPCGAQLVGRRGRTLALLDVAERCEAALKDPDRRGSI